MTRSVTTARYPLSAAPTPTSSLYFGDTVAVVTVANNAVLQGLTALTMEAMVFIGTTPAVLTRIFDFNVASNLGFNFEVNGLGGVPILQANVTNGSATGNLQVGNVTKYTWHHVAASWDGTTIRTFVDGVVQGITAPLSAGNTGNPAANLLIGNSGSANRGFLGLMQELRISNTARYTITFTPPTSQFATDANTIGLWHCNDGTGTSLIDSSGNSLTGTLGGATLPKWSTGQLTTLGAYTRLTSGLRTAAGTRTLAV